MSKRKIRNRSLSASLTHSTNNKQQNYKQNLNNISTTLSIYMPKQQQKQHNINLTYYNKQKLFNKNISFFRNHFNPNDSSLLPFMSGLRKQTSLNLTQKLLNSKQKLSNSKQKFNKSLSIDNNQSRVKRFTQTRPFSVSQKRTMNQQISKKIFDPNAKQSRISTAYYRWHNKSGKSIKNSVEFQCSLRDYRAQNNLQEKGFFNMVKPIQYIDIQPKIFSVNQLMCPRQRRLFRLKQD